MCLSKNAFWNFFVLKNCTKWICAFIHYHSLRSLQEEGDGNYLENSDSENDTVDENNDSVHNAYLETSFPYDFQDESDSEFAEP